MRVILLGIILNCCSAFTQKPDRFVFNSNVKINHQFNYRTAFPIVVDASFPGGMKEFDNFLKNNIVYPEALISQGFNGKIYVQFTIDQDGKVNDIRIRGMEKYPECVSEIERLFESMPKWIPAINIKNEIKRSYYSVPIILKSR